MNKKHITIIGFVSVISLAASLAFWEIRTEIRYEGLRNLDQSAHPVLHHGWKDDDQTPDQSQAELDEILSAQIVRGTQITNLHTVAVTDTNTPSQTSNSIHPCWGYDIGPLPLAEQIQINRMVMEHPNQSFFWGTGGPSAEDIKQADEITFSNNLAKIAVTFCGNTNAPPSVFIDGAYDTDNLGYRMNILAVGEDIEIGDRTNIFGSYKVGRGFCMDTFSTNGIIHDHKISIDDAFMVVSQKPTVVESNGLWFISFRTNGFDVQK